MMTFSYWNEDLWNGQNLVRIQSVICLTRAVEECYTERKTGYGLTR